MLLRAHNRLYTLCHFLPGSIVVNIQRHYTVPTRSVSKLLRTQTPITYVLLTLVFVSLPSPAPPRISIRTFHPNCCPRLMYSLLILVTGSPRVHL
jgi:hypothetical protein